MLKNIIFRMLGFCSLIAMNLNAGAQVSVGAKGGLNVSNLNGLNVDNYDSKAMIGFQVGGYVTFNLGRNFAIQPEVVYSTQGGTIESGSLTQDMKLNYFNIPVMVKFLTKKGFYLEAGPQLGFRTGDVKTEDVPATIENSDFSICGGLGFQPTKKAFGIGARYNAGLGTTGELDNPSLSDADFKNGVFQLSLYWRLFGGGKLKK